MISKVSNKLNITAFVLRHTLNTSWKDMNQINIKTPTMEFQPAKENLKDT